MSSDVLTMNLDDSNRAVVYLHGATITSWVSENKEKLFVSKKSIFDNAKAIRGGIPICFPNFGPWTLGPQHGFARVKKWSIKSPIKCTNETVSLVLSLTDDEETRKMWDYKFEVNYEIKLSKNNLETRITTINTGDVDFDFTCLLHTYFGVEDISKVEVFGLKGLEYIDKVKSSSKCQETDDPIKITQETDRVYMSTSETQFITTGHGKVTLKKENLPDTVLWNPWVEKAKAMSDFCDEEYKQMVCLEAGYVNKRYLLKPKQSVLMGQIISC